MKQSSKPIFVYPSVITVALYYAVLGYLIPAMREKFSLSLAEAGLFSTMQSIGYFVALALCFCVFPALNKPRVMAASLVIFTLCLVGMAVVPAMWMLCALFFFTGIFVNTIDSLSNAVMADLAPDAKGRHIGLLQALFSAIGAAAPYFGLLLGGDYVIVFFCLAAFALLTLAPFGFGLRTEMRRPMLQNPQGFRTVIKVFQLFKLRGVPAVAILALLIMSVQVIPAFFLSSYVKTFSLDPGMGALALCMLYTGAMLGRIIFAHISRRIDPYRIMVVYNTLALAGMAALALTPDATAICLLALLPGFGMSANFPGLVVEACGLIPDDSAAASALIFLGVNAAVLISPPLIGLVGDHLGLQAAFAISGSLLIPVIIMSARLAKHKAVTSACAESLQL